MSGGLAAKEGDFGPAAPEAVREEEQQGLVCGGVHRRGGDPHAEFPAGDADDLVAAGAGLDLEAQEGAVGAGLEVGGHGWVC